MTRRTVFPVLSPIPVRRSIFLDPVEEVPVMSEVSVLSSVSVAHVYGDGGSSLMQLPLLLLIVSRSVEYIPLQSGVCGISCALRYIYAQTGPCRQEGIYKITQD